MKECVYGWYPPAGSRWTTTNKQLQSYDKECLYRHKKSRFNALATKTPDSEKGSDPLATMEIRGTSAFANSPTPPAEGRTASRSSSAQSKSASRPTSTASQKMWNFKTSRTPITLDIAAPRVDQSLGPIPRPFDSGVMASAPELWASRPSSSAVGVKATFTPGRRSERAKSAYTHRPKSELPKRPVFSAGPVRPGEEVTAPMKEPLEIPTAEAETKATDLGREARTGAKAPTPGGAAGDATTAATTATPAPAASEDGEDTLPDVPEDDEESLVDGSDEPSDTSVPITDYETVLKTYGWRAEIPGDPYNLKRPCLQKRLPYTMHMPTPFIPPNPPRGHMQNYDTFFSNTIPRKPLSFSIHREWISEVLHAKRIALQKREEAEGINYKHTNFSFIY